MDEQEEGGMTRIEEIQSRLSKATPGPWEEHQDVVRIGFEEMEPLSVVKCVRTSGKTEVHYVAPWVNNEDDQTFIAAAPADVAYLLAELRKAQDALGRVEGLALKLDRCHAAGTPYAGDMIRAAVAAATAVARAISHLINLRARAAEMRQG